MTTDAEPESGATQEGTGSSPDPEGTAARLLDAGKEESPRRGPGRPPGAKSKPKTGTKKAGGAPAAPPIDTPPTEAEIAGVAMVWRVLWEVVAVRLGKLKRLELDEQRQLSQATIPVLRKYLPLATEYGPEIALVSCVGMMVISHLPTPEPAKPEIEG